MSHSRRFLLQVAALEVWREVERCLTAGGVASLPVKGLVTARWLYADPAERELSDIDIRVRPSDLAKVRRLGLAAGWTLIRESRVYGQVTFRVAGVDVDIESSCGPPGLILLPIGDIIARAAVSKLPLLREIGPIPDFHDHLIFMVVNVVKDHLIDANPWAVEDLRRVVRLPELDIARLIRRATDARALAMVLMVARYLGPQEATWRDIAVRIAATATPETRMFVQMYEASLRAGKPRWALRIGARLASDGWVRPALSLGRAGAWEAERLLVRLFPRVASHRGRRE